MHSMCVCVCVCVCACVCVGVVGVGVGVLCGCVKSTPPYLPFLPEGPGIPLIGVEFNCCLTHGDEKHLPPSQDGQCYRDPQTHKEGDDQKGSLNM